MYDAYLRRARRTSRPRSSMICRGIKLTRYE
ncbi:Uncharacterised protein [Mycobacteroides abscessus subsp. abscessus]|nr:Uncharacterised protein [Mycobacteroides abscessus subsp. abscessus]